jgi:site-specific DNA-methyltransferase (adenine-specific)
MKATLYVGDCLKVLPTLKEESIETCISDPPYGIKFMGSTWDHGTPGSPYWRKVLKVLKPGASLLSFGGTRTYHRLTCAIEDSGFDIRDCIMWLYSSGFPKSYNVGKHLEGWEGYGTNLKPAWEPIILAMKRVKGNFIKNAQEYEVAGLNIGECRIGNEEIIINTFDDGAKPFGDGAGHKYTSRKSNGRWPANVILDEEAGSILDKQNNQYGDSGGASRFFYCSKASKKERGPNNEHPTVKPIDLMRYLCRLTKTPKGGTILDPFMGSGTTGLAALHEGRGFIGIEDKMEYAEIAQQRIASEFGQNSVEMRKV